MTVTPGPAERLLALLEEDGAIEGLPEEQVAAALDAFGIDPARSLAFARAMAGDGDSPGGRLIGAIAAAEEAEEAEDEIARIEAADIGAVRARVSERVAALTAAEARRRADTAQKVVALRPQRSRWRTLGWAGSLTGIAASLLVALAVGQLYLSGMPGQVKRSVAPVSELQKTEAEADAPQFADSAQEEPLRKQEFRRAAPAEPLAEPLAEREAAPPPAAGLAAPAPAARQEGFALTESAPAEAPPAAPRVDELSAEPGRSRAKALGNESDMAGRDMAGGGAALETKTKADAPAIDAMLLVTPEQAPAPLQSQLQAQALPAGRLAERVEEARELAGGREVIALYTLRQGAARQDFAQVPLHGGLTQQMAAPAPLSALLGPDSANYDFIALPAR